MPVYHHLLQVIFERQQNDYILYGHSPLVLAFKLICHTNSYSGKGFIFQNISLKNEVTGHMVLQCLTQTLETLCTSCAWKSECFELVF